MAKTEEKSIDPELIALREQVSVLQVENHNLKREVDKKATLSQTQLETILEVVFVCVRNLPKGSARQLQGLLPVIREAVGEKRSESLEREWRGQK